MTRHRGDGTSDRRAIAALAAGAAFVLERYAGQQACVPPMVALNVLRELETLLNEAISEVAVERRIPVPCSENATGDRLDEVGISRWPAEAGSFNAHAIDQELERLFRRTGDASSSERDRHQGSTSSARLDRAATVYAAYAQSMMVPFHKEPTEALRD